MPKTWACKFRQLCARSLTASAAAALLVPTLSTAPASADPDFRHRHVIEVRHGHPPHYHRGVVPREHFYHGVRVYRPYGPRYHGYGYFYDDAAAVAFLGLTAWTLSSYAALNEAQMRAQEAAMAQATNAPLNEPIEWNDSGSSGSVVPVRDGHTNDGRACREFQQKVTIGGKTEQAYGTACQQPDGSWQIVKDMP
jgi:surface antigen